MVRRIVQGTELMVFEIDPNLVASAIRDGRKLFVEIKGTSVRVTLGDPSPHVKEKKK